MIKPIYATSTHNGIKELFSSIPLSHILLKLYDKTEVVFSLLTNMLVTGENLQIELWTQISITSYD